MMKLRWRNNLFTIVSLHHRDFTIVSSLFHHRAVVFSSSYHRAIALLLLYHRAERLRETKMLLMSKRNTVIGRYLNDTISRLVRHLAGISRLASHLCISVNSFPFILFYIKLTFFSKRYKPILENKTLSHFKEL
jgi:hypothetical protein